MNKLSEYLRDAWERGEVAYTMIRKAEALEARVLELESCIKAGAGGLAMRTEQQIVDQTNEFARQIYRLRGYEISPGYRFDCATHPHEIEAWRIACAAQILLTETDPEDALQDLEGR